MRLGRRFGVIGLIGVISVMGGSGCQEGMKFHPDGGADSGNPGGRGTGGISSTAGASGIGSGGASPSGSGGGVGSGGSFDAGNDVAIDAASGETGSGGSAEGSGGGAGTSGPGGSAGTGGVPSMGGRGSISGSGGGGGRGGRGGSAATGGTPGTGGQVDAGMDVAPTDAGSPDVDVACGAAKQPCCTSGSACGSGLQCASGMCTACGGSGQACCTSGTACGNGTTCASNKCVTCGGTGQPCCTSGNACGTGMTCATNQCVACGGSGQPCCGTTCNSGFACSNGTCGCGGSGQACCATGAKCTGTGLACGGNNTCTQCGGSGQPCCTSGSACSTNMTCASNQCVACGAMQQACCPSGTACRDANSACSGGTCVFSCGTEFACGGRCYTSNVAICADTTKCASWDFESDISGWQGEVGDNTVTLGRVTSPGGRTTKSLAITFTNRGDVNGFGGALINLCGTAIRTDNLKLRAQVYVQPSLGEGLAVAQTSNMGSEESRTVPAGTWSTVEIPFGVLGSATQLGIHVAAGGQGASGTIYIDSLEIFQ